MKFVVFFTLSLFANLESGRFFRQSRIQLFGNWPGVAMAAANDISILGNAASWWRRRLAGDFSGFYAAQDRRRDAGATTNRASCSSYDATAIFPVGENWIEAFSAEAVRCIFPVGPGIGWKARLAIWRMNHGHDCSMDGRDFIIDRHGFAWACRLRNGGGPGAAVLQGRRLVAKTIAE